MTPFATTLAPWQACDVWSSLEDALQGRASHGHEAEIYAYRLLPSLPTAESATHNRAFGATETGRRAMDEAARLAFAELRTLVEAFAEAREVVCVIDPYEPFLHRVKVRVEARR